MEQNINIFIVFLAGLGTFLSPCIIPIVPSYLSYISGVVIGEEINSKKKWWIIRNTIFFILGFGSAFSILQLIISKFTNFASLFLGNKVLNIVFGIFIIVMGLNILGVFKIKKLYSEKRMELNFIKRNFITSYLFGFAFGFGWAPCMGPILFTIFSYLSLSATLNEGILYIWIFTLGLGFPFLIFSFFMDNIVKLTTFKKKFLFSDKISGFLLIIMGILLTMDKLTIFTNWNFIDSIVEFLKIK
ncbi:MAG: cytochrome c biogenesis CcdA family protein [Fusobacteriaceae bacterium]